MLFKKNKRIYSLCKINKKEKSSTPTDIDMCIKGYKFKFGDITRWERIAYFKTEEEGIHFAKEQGYKDW